jgi:alpha-glucosidase (family GH31 glycosyl hydrolase)
VSRSSAITQGSLDGNVNNAARWLENYSTIQDMSNSITDIMQQNIMGITMSGSNICGYHWNTSPELCARWYKIGAFYPLAVNHNSRDSSPQAPHDFPEPYKSEIQDAMTQRYSLLRYMNTRLFKHSLWSDETDDGGTFFKPLFFEFPEDDAAYDFMSLNAMFGPSIKLSL